MIASLLAAVGGVLILFLSATYASDAHAHEFSGQPLPNGKGGFMRIRDGYEAAVFLLVIGLAWLGAAWRFLHGAFSARQPGPPGDELEGTLPRR